MKAQHTPGPWFVKQPGEHSPTNIRIVRSHGKTIGGGEMFGAVAEVCISRPISSAAHPSPEEQANARLLVAAPDLLSACKAQINQCLGSLEEGIAWAAKYRGEPSVNKPLLAMIDAIARAEGNGEGK